MGNHILEPTVTSTQLHVKRRGPDLYLIVKIVSGTIGIVISVHKSNMRFLHWFILV